MFEYGNDRSINLLKSDRVFYLHWNGAQSPICLPLRFRATRWGRWYKWYSRCEAFISQQMSSPRHITCSAEKGLVALGIIHLNGKSKNFRQ